MDMTVTGRIGPHLRRQWSDAGVEQLRILPRRSWKIVAIAAGLLLLKDLQFFTHAFTHRTWFENAMMAVWIGLLLLWLIAALGEFVGTETISVSRGELIISRGIGPLRRNWRFKVNRIAELTAAEPTDDKGKRHLQHIFFKPKLGSVRFIYDRSTICFADWLDKGEGEQVVRWLKPRLPSAALQVPPFYEVYRGGTANLKL